MSTFYNEDIRRATAVFGSLFNNIELRAIDRSNGRQTRDIQKVRLTHGPKEKVIEKALQGITKGSDPAISTILPAISFTHKINGVDENRKLPSNRRMMGIMIDENTRLNTRVPIPYKVTFEMTIITRHIDELLQIIEQIVPSFQMSKTVFVKKYFNTEEVINSSDIFSENMTFVLRNVSNEYEYEGSSNQINTANLEFETVVNMYGEYSELKNIRWVDVNYYAYKRYDPEGTQEKIATIEIDGTNIEDYEEYQQLLIDDGINTQIIVY